MQYSAWLYRFMLPLHGGQLLLIDGHLLSKGQAVSGNCIHLLSGATEMKVNSNTKHLPSTSSIMSIISATQQRLQCREEEVHIRSPTSNVQTKLRFIRLIWVS